MLFKAICSLKPIDSQTAVDTEETSVREERSPTNNKSQLQKQNLCGKWTVLKTSSVLLDKRISH